MFLSPLYEGSMANGIGNRGGVPFGYCVCAGKG